MSFRGPQALKYRVESRSPGDENKAVTERTFVSFRGPQALKYMDEFPIDGVFAHHSAAGRGCCTLPIDDSR